MSHLVYLPYEEQYCSRGCHINAPISDVANYTIVGKRRHGTRHLARGPTEHKCTNARTNETKGVHSRALVTAGAMETLQVDK